MFVGFYIKSFLFDFCCSVRNKHLFTKDSLNCNPKPALDVTLLIDNGHLVDEWHRVHEVAQIDEAPADHSEPGEAVVEGIASGQVLDVVVWGGGRQLCLIVVHLTHQLQPLTAKIGDGDHEQRLK